MVAGVLCLAPQRNRVASWQVAVSNRGVTQVAVGNRGGTQVAVGNRGVTQVELPDWVKPLV